MASKTWREKLIDEMAAGGVTPPRGTTFDDFTDAKLVEMATAHGGVTIPPKPTRTATKTKRRGSGLGSIAHKLTHPVDEW